jgi:hypothetical protein
LEIPVTADTALCLSRYFGTTPSFWMGMQAQYDLELAADRIGTPPHRTTPRGVNGFGEFPRQAMRHPPPIFLRTHREEK